MHFPSANLLFVRMDQEILISWLVVHLFYSLKCFQLTLVIVCHHFQPHQSERTTHFWVRCDALPDAINTNIFQLQTRPFVESRRLHASIHHGASQQPWFQQNSLRRFVACLRAAQPYECQRCGTDPPESWIACFPTWSSMFLINNNVYHRTNWPDIGLLVYR